MATVVNDRHVRVNKKEALVRGMCRKYERPGANHDGQRLWEATDLGVASIP